MTARRNQHLTIPSAEGNCSLDLSLTCPDGDKIFVPFGVVETQTLEEPKTEQEKTATIAIAPKIFNDASFDKSRASAPSFIEHIEGIPANTACGYIYIFVDGYLWREIACVGLGVFSDVDLMQSHSKDIRPHVTKSAEKIIIPTKTKQLYNETTLAPVVVEMAFSRVQWSWQYINDLGGMFETDKRFALAPLQSKCMDVGRAELLRTARCQKFDFTQKPTPSECEFIETKDNDYVVYLHDMLGIAQRYYALLDDMVNVLDGLYQHNKSKPYYDSALLAYQLYLNEGLHKRIYDYRHGKYNLKETSDDAEKRREIATLFDAEEIEKLLVTPEEIETLERYLDTREVMADFFNGTYEKQKITTLCRQNNIHTPVEWHVAMRDVSTLSKINYHTGQAVVYNILNRLVQPMAQLPIFIKAITNGNKKYLLKVRMKKIEAVTYDLMASLADTEDSWLRLQFCANVDAFGVDMKQVKAEDIDTQDEPGTFNPEKLSEAFELPSEQQHYLGEILKTVKESSVLSAGVLAFWKTNLAEEIKKNAHNIEKSFKVVGPTLKSMGTGVFKNLEFSKFGEIPEGYTVVGADIVEHTLFDGPKYKRARRALENAVHAIDTGKEIAKRDLKILEKYAPHGTHTSSSEQRNAVVTDRHTGATVGVTTRAGARALIQKGLDVKGFLQSLRTLEFKVLIVPTSSILQLHAHQFNQENPLRRVHGLRLDNIGKYSKNFHQALPGALFLLDSMLTVLTYSEYKKNFDEKGAMYQRFKHTALLAEWAASGAQAYEAYISSRTVMSKELYPEKVKRYNKAMKQFKHSMKITRLSIGTGVAGLFGAGITAWDAWHLMQKQDNDAAAYAAASAGTGVALAGASAIGLSGPIVWALLLGSVALGILSSMLVNSDTENWAEFGPFAKNKTKRLTRFQAFKSAKAYYNFISSVLMSPSVEIKRISQSNNFIITINTPLYDELDTDVYIKVKTQENVVKNGQVRKVNIKVPINHTFLDKKITHKIAEPQEIRNHQGRVTQIEYQAYFKMDYVDFIEVKTNLVTHNVCYPQKLSGYETIAYNTADTCYSENTAIEQVVNQPDWARDKYSNALFSRIIDEITALF